jgi:hypothetical protein
MTVGAAVGEKPLPLPLPGLSLKDTLSARAFAKPYEWREAVTAPVAMVAFRLVRVEADSWSLEGPEATHG